MRRIIIYTSYITNMLLYLRELISQNFQVKFFKILFIILTYSKNLNLHSNLTIPNIVGNRFELWVEIILMKYSDCLTISLPLSVCNLTRINTIWSQWNEYMLLYFIMACSVLKMNCVVFSFFYRVTQKIL